MTTVICLDDYHCLDRNGRKVKGVTALAPEAQNFDLMYNQVKALKDGKAVDKPIYNHVTGLLDAPETIDSPNVRLNWLPAAGLGRVVVPAAALPLLWDAGCGVTHILGDPRARRSW
jgi:hypothetical protein